MAKKKKHNSTKKFSGIPKNNRLFFGFSKILDAKTVNDVRENMIIASRSMQLLCGKLGIQEPNTLMLAEDNPLREQFVNDSVNTYFVFSMHLSEYIWYKNRLAYHFSPAAVDFINSEQDIFDKSIIPALATRYITQPIMVMFPDGSGFFYTKTNMRHDFFRQKESETHEDWLNYPVHLICGFGEFHNIVNIHRPCETLDSLISGNVTNISGTKEEHENINKTLRIPEDYSVDDQMKAKNYKIWKALIYLNAILGLQATEQEVFGLKKMPNSIMFPADEYTVPGMQPEWNFAPDRYGVEILKYGVHPMFGYLSLDRMRKAFADMDEDGANISFQGDAVNIAAPVMDECSTKEVYLMGKKWMEHTTLFSVSSAMMDTLQKRYDGSIDKQPWANHLQYIPMNEFIIHYPDASASFMISKRDKMHISIYPMLTGSIIHKPYMLLAIDGCGKDKGIRRCFHAMMHIASYYKRRQEKQAEINLKNKQETTTSLAKPIEAQKTNPDVHKISNGYDISLNNLNVFNVSTKSVKRLTHKEAQTVGWIMPTHVRRGHIHRYWVGSGESKHLEERYVEAVVVNKDKQGGSITEHKVN